MPSLAPIVASYHVARIAGLNVLKKGKVVLLIKNKAPIMFPLSGLANLNYPFIKTINLQVHFDS
jgi:hypothetical protein